MGYSQIIWNFTSSATAPSSSLPTGVVSAALAQVNTGTTGTSLTSPSDNSGASGGNNLAFSGKSGVLNTGTTSYFEFTITPSANYSITITSVSFGSRSTSSGPLNLDLYNSASLSSNLGALTAVNDSAWALKSFTGLSVSSTSALALRVYGYGGSSTASNWRMDDLTIGLTATPIPEPSTFALLGGLAALGFVGFRRSRANRI